MKKILKYIAVLFVGIGISAGGTVLAAQISVPSASSVGQLLTSLSTGNWQASTSPTVWGTFTAKNFVATSTTADSVFPRLSVTNSTTTAATSTSFFSTLLRATTGYFSSLFLTPLATPSGSFLAVDANGQIIATTTPSGGSGTPGGSDTQVQFNDGGAFNGESGFTYQKSPTELVTMANGTVSGELRSNSLHETSAGIVGLNLDTTNITAQIGSGGFFKLKDGTSAFELSIDTAALTGNHALGAPDKDGTIAVLSDITNASSTLYADNGTFSGSNRFGDDTSNIFLSSTGVNQRGTNYPQNPLLSLATNIDFIFDRPADPATSGGGISFTANNGGTGDTDGGSLNFTSGLPSGTGATGTMKVYTGSDLIFEGASSTVATSTFYSNLHVKGGLKIGDASILLQGNSTSTFSKGIELTGGCFKVAGACLSSGGSGASSTLLTDSSTFSGANRFATLLVTGSSTLQNFTGINSTTTNATTTSLYTNRFTPSGLGACNSSTQKPITDGAGNWTCGTDTSGGGGGSANATNTIDWIIYPYGSNVAVWRAKTQSAVTTFTDFDDAANYVVNLATSSVPAENSIKIGTGVYQVNATTTMDGNGVGFSAVKFFWYGNGTSTMLVVNNNTSAFFMTDRARVHFEDIGFNLNGGADAFYASTTQASPVSSLNESEFFGIKAYSSGINHTGWVFHFKDAFRYHIADFHAKDVGNCFSDENNYSNNAFINGDGQIDGFNFCELNNPTAGVNNGGRVVSLYGRQGLVNQMVFKNINGITNSNNSTMFYINHASRVVIEDNNSEQFATTTDIINSNGVNMKTTKYLTPWNALANATLISTDANSYNNTFSLSEVELSAATYIFKDSNTIAPTRPNILQGYNGGQFVFGDNGGSALWATTTSTVVRDVFDNIGAGTNSYLGRVKITGGNIAMDFLNSRTTLFQYSNSAYRWLVAGTERMTLSAAGLLGVGSSTPGTSISVGTGANFINLSDSGTSTYAKGINISGGCFAIGGNCLSSGGSGASTTLLANNNTFSGQNIFADILRSTTTQATTTTLFATSASTSAFYGAGLATCNSAASALTYSNGTFGCNSISGSGTVNSGTLGQTAYYGAAGTAVSGTSTILINSDQTVAVGGASANAQFNVKSLNGQAFQVLTTSASDIAFSTYNSGDGFTRFSFLGDGTMKWGDGSASADVGLNRTAAGTLNFNQYGAATDIKIGIGTTTPYAKLSVQGVFGSQNPLFNIASSTGTNGYLSLFSVMANGRIESTYQSGTTTKPRVYNEPDGIAATAVVANYTATYSDDPTRMLACGAIANTGVTGLRNGSFAASGVSNVYSPGGIQQHLAASSIANGVSTIIVRGCVTAEGYHYLFLASTTNAAATSVRRATSSDFTELAIGTAWATSTVSGVALATTGFLVGYERGNLYIATSTTAIAKYAVGTTSNTLTYVGTITITGANITFANTRVNDNGIYAGFAAAPMVRKYTLQGVAVPGVRGYVVGAPTNGPDFFAMKNSVYIMNGASTVYISRIQGW